jgi:hypothetical protein
MLAKRCFRIARLTIGLLLIGGCSRGGDAPFTFNSIANEINHTTGDWVPSPPIVAIETPQEADNHFESEQPDPAAVERKVVYNADLTLTVKDLDKIKHEVQSLVERHGGYLAQFSERRDSGDERSGRWVVRVPADSFHPLLADVQQLGKLDSEQIRSEELTEEFVDLQARLSTKRQLEQQMLKIMQERAGDISDALTASSRLNDVRLEIERIEGRLRKLNELTALSTVTIDAREEPRPAEPPPPAAVPSFGAALGATFTNSLGRLIEFGKDLLLAAATLAPWIAALCIVTGPLALANVVVRRRKLRQTA